MKKIIALALALIMALSMASVAFAADYAAKTTVTGMTKEITGNFAPGAELTFNLWGKGALKSIKLDEDFTTGSLGYKGASLIESIKINKNKDSVVVTLKESTKLLEEARVINGEIDLIDKNGNVVDTLYVKNVAVNNNYVEVTGEKKAAKAIDIGADLWGAANTVFVMDEDGGYVKFTDKILTATVKMDAEEEAFVNVDFIDADTKEALEEVLGEDYDAIVETYMMNGNGFKNEVSYTYKAYEEDPHFFYGFDGEKLFALDAKYDADEDVDAYVFSYTGAGVIVITDEEVVLAAEETKNPDTGANDVVGVAAALAVVSLVAAGAVSLKK